MNIQKGLTNLALIQWFFFFSDVSCNRWWPCYTGACHIREGSCSGGTSKSHWTLFQRTSTICMCACTATFQAVWVVIKWRWNLCTTRTVSRPMSGNVFANACRNFHLPKMLCYILLVAISFAVSVPTYMTAGLAEGQAKSAPLSDSEVSEGAIQLYHAQRLVHQATNMLEKRSFCTQCRDDTVRSALLKINKHIHKKCTNNKSHCVCYISHS